MYIKKENYRKFERQLFLYEGAFEHEFGGDVKSNKVEKNETSIDYSKRDWILEIKNNKDLVIDKINDLKGKLPNAETPAAKELFLRVESSTEERFNDLNQDYYKAKEKIGSATWEGSQKQKEIIGKAEKLAHDIIKNELENKADVEKMVKEYLEKVPDTQAKNEEKKLIDTWIQETEEPGKTAEEGNLAIHYGDGKEPGPDSEYYKRVLEVMAQKYDIRFEEKKGWENDKIENESEGKKVMYGVNILTQEVYGRNDLKKAILEELKPGGDFSPDNIQAHEFDVINANNKIKRLVKEIDQGSARALGGEIKELKDWIDHKGVDKLNLLTKGIQPKVEKILSEMLSPEQEDRLEKYDNLMLLSDLKEKFKAAEGAGYTHLKDQSDKINPKQDDFTSKEVLTKDGVTITVAVDAESRINLTIESNNPAFKTEQSFSNPADFKEINFVAQAGEQSKNAVENQAKVEAFDKLINDLGLEKTVSTTTYKPEELVLKDFTLKPATLSVKIGETFHPVGSLTVLDANHLIIEVAGKTSGPIEKNDLSTEIQKLNKEMMKVATEAAQRKSEIETQVNQLNIPNDKNYSVEKVDLQGDFSNPEGYVDIVQLRRTGENTPFATLKISVGDKEGKRIFNLVSEDGTQNYFESEAQIKEFLEKKGVELARPKEKPKDTGEEELTGTLAEIALKEKAKDNIQKSLLLTNPEIKDYIDQNNLNKLINGLSPQTIEKYASAENLSTLSLSPTELKDLMESGMKAAGVDKIEKIDPNEIKIIAATRIEVGGKVAKFGEFFGGDIVKMVSMTQEVREVEGKSVVKEGEQEISATGEALISKLPTNIKEGCQKVLKGEVTDMTELKKASKFVSEGMENITKFTELAKNEPELVKTFEGKNTRDKMGSILLAFQLIAEMFGNKDYQSIGDVWNALNSKKGLEGTMKETKETYKKGIEAAPLEELLKLHQEPNGELANSKFGKTTFRSELKNAVLEKLGDSLAKGVKVSDLKVDGHAKATLKGREFEVYFPESTGADKFSIKEIKAGVNNEFKEYDVKEGLTGNGNTLEAAFAIEAGLQAPSGEIASENLEISKYTKIIFEQTINKENASSILTGKGIDKANLFKVFYLNNSLKYTDENDFETKMVIKDLRDGASEIPFLLGIDYGYWEMNSEGPQNAEHYNKMCKKYGISDENELLNKVIDNPRFQADVIKFAKSKLGQS